MSYIIVEELRHILQVTQVFAPIFEGPATAFQLDGGLDFN